MLEIEIISYSQHRLRPTNRNTALHNDPGVSPHEDGFILPCARHAMFLYIFYEIFNVDLHNSDLIDDD